MPTNTIHQTFPSELTMWIDPLEVSYRIGENGSICILYEYKENQGTGNAPWRPAPVPTTQSRSKTSSPTTLVGGKGSTTSGSRSTATSQQVSVYSTWTIGTIRGRLRRGPGLPNFWNNEKKCVYNKRTIKVCVECS